MSIVNIGYRYYTCTCPCCDFCSGQGSFCKDCPERSKWEKRRDEDGDYYVLKQPTTGGIMSRKTVYKVAFTPPTAEAVAEAVNRAGGKRAVSQMLCKNWNTVDRWMDGRCRIDYANWTILQAVGEEQ